MLAILNRQPDIYRKMVNVVDVIVPIIVGFITIAASIYLFAIYCHRNSGLIQAEERSIGNSPLLKILVILSQTLAWSQILLLPLDLGVQGASPSSTFPSFYYALYPIIFVIVAFINPLAIFLYETDPDEPFSKRICWSSIFAGISAAVWLAYSFFSYIGLGVYDVQGQSQRIQVSLYLLLAMSLPGWVLLAVNGAVGLVLLPFDLIAYFVGKPTPLTTEQAFAKKKALQVESGDLIGEGEKLRAEGEQLQHFQGGWFSKKRAESKFQKLMEKFKERVGRLEGEYELFTQNLERDETHPAVYITALLLGCLATVVSVIWVFQIMGHVFRQDGHPLYSFLDSWFAQMSGGSGSFFASLLYGAMVIYLQICLAKGNCVFGLRIPFIMKVHPLVPNKTYMNSLLFNSNLMLLASCSISFLALWSFPNYFNPEHCFLASFFQYQVDRLPLFGGLYGNRIPLTILEALVLLVLLVLAVRAGYRHCRDKKNEEKAEKSRN